MHQLGYRDINRYLDLLGKDEEARKECECLMTVSVSRFFRDLYLWKIIGEQMVPDLIGHNKDEVRFWSAGCACGEEVYTFKIVWDGLYARFDRVPELKIWATDLNPYYVSRAQEGIYSFSSLKEVPQELRAKYFIYSEEEDVFSIVPFLKVGISWKIHDLLKAFPGKRFQIIFLRNNILTYFKNELKVSAIAKVLGKLERGGFLVIGSHEKLPMISRDLIPLSGLPYIFRKIVE